MATDARVRRLKAQVYRLHGAKEMRAKQISGLHTEKTLNEYYEAFEKFDDALSEYYAAKIMLMKIKNPDLFDLYLNFTKQEAKSKMLRQITKTKDSKLSHQLNVRRILELKKEIKETQNQDKKKYLKQKLTRMEAWAKDINY